jgi:hypothetical protein
MGAYGKFGKVIKAARSVGAKADVKALRGASTTARIWMAADAGKIADAGRDEVTSSKRAAAAWIAEEAELDLELANVNSLSLDASATAIAAKLRARVKQVEVHKILANGGEGFVTQLPFSLDSHCVHRCGNSLLERKGNWAKQFRS